MNTKIGTITVALWLTAAVVQGANLIWTNGSGSFDDGTKWNTGNPPSNGDGTTFTNNASYTVVFPANPVVINSNVVKAGTVTLDISGATWNVTNSFEISPATVSLTGGALNAGAILFNGNNGSLTLAGALVSNGAFTVSGAYNTLTVTNATLLTTNCWIGTAANFNGNVINVLTGGVWNLQGGTLRVGDSVHSVLTNRLVINGGIVTNVGVLNWGDTIANQNSIVVTNGGKILITGASQIGNKSSFDAGTVVGTGSIWNGGAAGFTIGFRGAIGNVFVVADGGTATNLGALTIGGGTSGGATISNSVAVRNGGNLFAGTVLVGTGFSAASNNQYYVGGVGAACVVSNGTVTLGNTPGSGGNTMIVTNAILLSGAVVVGNATSNNTLNVLSNSTWRLVTGGLTVGSGAAIGNSVLIDAGAVTNASGVIVSDNNAMSIANAGWLGANAFSNAAAGVLTNNSGWIVLSGSNARFTLMAGSSSNSFSFNTGTLQFTSAGTFTLAGQDLGVGGSSSNYAIGNLLVDSTVTLAGGVALYCGNVTLASGSTLNVQGRKIYYAGLLVTNGATVNLAGGQFIAINDSNQPPTVAQAASASPNPVNGTTTALSVLGADDAGEGNLIYTWSSAGVGFSPNGSNPAKNSAATFSQAGSYNFQVIIQDQGSLTVTSATPTVVVNQTLTTINVSPSNVAVLTNSTQQFIATALDQFGMTKTAAFSWSVTGGGTINSSGLFTAGSANGGPFTVHAISGGTTGAASVTVSDTPGLFLSANTNTVGRYDVYELTMLEGGTYANPWEDVNITAVFTSPGGTNYTVGGFYYDTGTWKVRFAPMQVGAWNWTLTFDNGSVQYLTGGSFACTTSANTGFLRVHPQNLRRLITEGDGRPFYPNGYNRSVGAGSVRPIRGQTDDSGSSILMTQQLKCYRDAGINMIREGLQNFQHTASFNVGGTGKNIYKVYEGQLHDEIAQSFHATGMKLYQNMIARPTDAPFPGNYDISNPQVKQAFENYNRYIINRYGAYADVWELGGELGQPPLTQAFLDMIASVCSSNDPYHHFLTANYVLSNPPPPPTNELAITISSGHKYTSVSNLGLDRDWQRFIATEQSSYTNRPGVVGENGNHDPFGCYDPDRYRIGIWTAFSNMSGMLFWFQAPRFNYFDNGLANQYIGPEERGVAKILANFNADFDGLAVTQSVTVAPSSTVRGYVMASSQDIAGYFVHISNQHVHQTGATATLTVPANGMTGVWMDPATGTNGTTFTVNSGSQVLAIPSFRTDIALRIRTTNAAPVLEFSTASFVARENQGQVTISVKRTGSSAGAVSVNYTTVDDLALAGQHYTPASGTLSWANGDTTPKSFNVTLLHNSTFDADKDFHIRLSSPTGSAVLGNDDAMVTILEDDINTVMFSSVNYSVLKTAGSIAITVNRLGNGVGPAAVSYTTYNAATANASASDYTAITSPGILNWADGDVSPKTFTISILNNAATTTYKYFNLQLQSPMSSNTGIRPGYGRATVAILPNTTQAGLLQFTGFTYLRDMVGVAGYMDRGYAVTRTAGSINIPVSRTGGSNGAVSVTYSLDGGNAVSNADYTAVSGALSWADGDASDKFINVPVLANASSTGDVVIWVTLGSPTGGAALPFSGNVSAFNHVALLITDPNLPPVITSPQWATATEGVPFAYTITAAGNPTGFSISNVPAWLALNTSTGSLTGTPVSGTYNIGLRATNAAGTGADQLILVVAPASPTSPVILAQPADTGVTNGQAAAFSVTATGTAPLSYQWKKNNVTIAGAIGSSYTLAAPTLGDNGAQYTVVVSNSVSTVTSTAAVLTVTAAPVAPTITTQPLSQIVNAGQTVTLNVAASGTAPFTYQWYRNGVSVDGARFSSYTISPVTSAATYAVVINNGVDTVVSADAVITLESLQASTTGGPTFNSSTGYYEQVVTITNTSAGLIGGFQLRLTNVAGSVIGGTLNGGVWTIGFPPILGAGQFANVVIQCTAAGSPAVSIVPPPATIPAADPNFDRATGLPVFANPAGTTTLRFVAIPGRYYEIQYSPGLPGWSFAVGSIWARNNVFQWTDDGSVTGGLPAGAGQTVLPVEGCYAVKDLAAASVILMLFGGLAAADLPVKVTQDPARLTPYQVFELTFQYAGQYADPTWDVTIEVDFVSPSGKKLQVGGFFYGSSKPSQPIITEVPGGKSKEVWPLNPADLWKARYAPSEVGKWKYSCVFRDVAGKSAKGEGTFEVAPDRVPARGWLRINPANPHRLIFEDGSPFWPVGFQHGLGDPLHTGSLVARFSIDGMFKPEGPPTPPGAMFARGPAPTPIDGEEYFRRFAAAGFNLWRYSANNASPIKLFALPEDQNVNSRDHVRWEQARGIDEMLMLTRQHGIHNFYGFFGYMDVCARDVTNTVELAKVKRLIKYSVDRWGAYVDFWEFLNEQKADAEWYAIMIPYLKFIDPYHKPISTSWQRPEIDGIDINSPHKYADEDELESDKVVAGWAASNKSNGKIVIFGEQGNFTPKDRRAELISKGIGGVWDPGSARRMRARLWSAFFNEIAFIFWETTYARDGHFMNQYLGPEERQSVRALQDFAYALDAGIKMAPVTLRGEGAKEVRAYGVRSDKRAGVYFHHFTCAQCAKAGIEPAKHPFDQPCWDHDRGQVQDLKVTVDVPQAGRGYWYNPLDGTVIASFDVPAGALTVTVPPFTVDLALLITEPNNDFETRRKTSNEGKTNMNQILEADVAIIGGGFGGVAAALATADRGLRVVMTDEFDWVGGQVTSQALCVLDELYDPHGETMMNARYADFRERLRKYYVTKYKLSKFGARQLHLCAGNNAVTPVSAESHVAHAVLQEMLGGRVTILTRHIPVAAERDGDRVVSVTCEDLKNPGATKTVRARFFLDGTETGDTYPLLKLRYGLGSDPKSLTGEAHAPAEAEPNAVQSFTHCFIVEFVPGGNFTIPKPENYEKIRDAQPFRLHTPGAKFFQLQFDAKGFRIIPFWYYRCLVDHRNFEDVPYDRAVVNVNSNDYHGDSFIDHPRREEILAEAEELSRAFLYFLQTEAPRDDGGKGYPELRLVPEATGTPDGFAQGPYVREGRRLRACQMIVEEDLSTKVVATARARPFTNSVGLGAYFIDIHGRAGGKKGMGIMARPYQIPLGALVSPELKNFAAAGKCIGVTQITNGAYRLHPVEWAVGEAAGELAAFCLERKVEHPNLGGQALFAYQRQLLKRGIPLYWYEDVPPGHPAFEASQLLALTNIWPGHPDHLRFDPQQSICRHRPMFLKVYERLKSAGKDVTELRDLHVIAHGYRKYDTVYQLVSVLDEIGWPASAIAREFPPPSAGDDAPLDPAYLW